MSLVWLESPLLLIFTYLFTQFRYQATTFPPTRHALLLSLVLIYALIEPIAAVFPRLSRWKNLLKWGLIISLISLTTFWSFAIAIKLRHQIGPEYPVHDNPIQLEESAKFLIAGKNPYAQSFTETPLGDWTGWTDNPSINHVITLPFYVVSQAIVSLNFEKLTGIMDGRILHFFALVLTAFIFWKAKLSSSKKRLLTILFFFNPLFVHFFIDGRNDIVVFSLIFASMYFLHQRRWLPSAIFLGLAGATKQSSWLLFPLYLGFIYFQEKSRHRYQAVLKKILPVILTAGIFILPFLVWDARALIEDVFLFPAGKIARNYPIKGSGFSVNLVEWGIINSAGDSFPFLILEAIVCLPLLIFLIKYLSVKLSVRRLLHSYTFLLFAFWLFSRFFLENYIGYLSMLLLAAELFPEKSHEHNH